MPPLTPQELETIAAEVIQQVHPEGLIERCIFRDEVTLILEKSRIHDVIQALREDPRLQFDMLGDVTAIDWQEQGREPRFDVVYHLNSLEKHHRLRLRVPVGEDQDQCRIDSIIDLWRSADFMECEVYDMFGIRFDGHPDLRRILMPENWNGHPLRKDFPLGGSTSFYYKQDTDEYAGEPDDLIPRVRVQDSDV